MVQAMLLTFEYAATGNGGTVTGTFGYDKSAIDTIPGDSTAGFYPTAGFYNGTVSGGPQNGFSFDITVAEILIFNDYDAGGGPPQEYLDAFVVSDGSFTFIEFSNFTTTPPPVPPLDSDQLTSFLLPGALSNLGNWPTASVSVFDGEQFAYQLANVRQVPEPSILGLLVLGLAGISYQRLRRIF
jgi:hypothetical protein